MGIKKKKEYETVCFSVDTSQLERFEITSDKSNLLTETFIKMIKCTDGLEQINLAKQVGNHITNLEANATNIEESIIEMLPLVYLETNTRCALKKTLLSALKNVSDGYQDKILLSLENGLQSLLFLENPSINTMKHVMDNVLLCLDNFQLGFKAVMKNHINVFCFVDKSLSIILKILRTEISPQETTEIYSVALVIVKTLTVFLQQSQTQVNSVLQNVDRKQFFVCHVESIFHSIEQLLEDESTLLNCKINCGICLPLLLKFADIKLLSSLKNSQNNLVDMLPIYISKFPPSSQLCLWGGILSGLSTKELLKNTDQNINLFVHVLLPEILKLAERVNDSSMSLACSRVLHQWTDIACKILNENTCSSLPEQLNDDVIEQLLSYLWNHWDHFVDGVRHYCKIILKNVILLHCLCTGEIARNSGFVKNLIGYLLNDYWNLCGRYSVLCCLVEQVGSEVLLNQSPTLPVDIFDALGEKSLAPHVAELMIQLYKQDYEKLSSFKWEERWLAPLLKVLCFGTRNQKIAIKEHILPQVLKLHPSSIHFIISELSSEQDKCFSTLLFCIKTAQMQGITDIHGKTDADPEMWQGCLSFSILEKALSHIDSEVQLSALNLLCSNSKTTQLFTSRELELLKQFLPCCFCSQSPHFRQQLLAEIKKIISRIRDSGYALTKKLKKEINVQSENTELYERYKIFLEWITHHCFTCLRPGSNFPHRYTALQVLLLKTEIFGEKSLTDSSVLGCCSWNAYQAQTLFECLKDTYENNKIAALKLLHSCPAELLGFQNEDRVKAVLEASLILASGTRPTESVTAAHLLCLLMNYETTNKVALDMLTRLSASDDMCLIGNDINPVHKTTCLLIIQILLAHLRNQLDVASKSLLEAAANGPLYGIITCIRFVLAKANLSSIYDDEEAILWKNAVFQLITLCFKATDIVSPVVCNSSPEGHLPMDTDPETLSQLQSAIQKAIGRRFETAHVVEDVETNTCQHKVMTIDIVKTHAVTAQMLLLCSWRTHKEVSLLLGDICQQVAITDEKEGIGLLSSEQIMQIGIFFNQQLAGVKHRGAFEQAYVGFSKLCHRLWRLSKSSLHQLPKKWLQELFDSMCGKGDLKLVPTRRSAGVPFVVQALLITEPDVTGCDCFKQAMTTLLKLSQGTESSEAQVHSLNILRAIYRDTCLGERVMPYVADGIKTVITSFKTASWNIRNSATLLFTSLITRIFGVNRSKEEHQKKNCMTGRVFFLHFPSLFQFLLDELQEATESLSSINNCVCTTFHPTLYPILLILSRLYPSPIEGCDSNLKLSCFVPYVQLAACNSIWKTRVLAARALIPLVPPNEYSKFIRRIFNSFSSLDVMNQNKLHGKLLQVYYLLNEAINHGNNLTDMKGELSKLVKENFTILIELNPCYVTRAAFLSVVYLLLSHELVDLGKEDVGALYKKLPIRNISCDNIVMPGKTQYLTLSSAVELLFMLRIPMTDEECLKLIKYLIKSTHYEVRALVLHFLKWLLTQDAVSHNNTFNSIPTCHQLRWPSKCETKYSLAKIIVHSESTILILLQMMLTEEQPNCLEELYSLLCYIPNIASRHWPVEQNESFSLLKKLMWLLEKMEATDWDDVVNAMLHLSLNIALCCYNEFTHETTELENSLSIMKKWMETIESNSFSDQSIVRRKTVAVILEKAAPFFMLDPKRILGSHAILVWNALIILIQDDEPTIRQISASVIIHLMRKDQRQENQLHLTPLLGLEFILKKFVEQFRESHRIQCLTTLCNWMLQCDEDLSVQGDEQPFDKGEMNIYAEELAFTDLVAVQLTDLLQSTDNVIELVLFESIANEHTLSGTAFACLRQAEEFIDTLAQECRLSSLKCTTTQVKLYQHIKLFFCIFYSCSLKISCDNVIKKLNDLQCLSAFLYTILQQLRICQKLQS